MNQLVKRQLYTYLAISASPFEAIKYFSSIFAPSKISVCLLLWFILPVFSQSVTVKPKHSSHRGISVSPNQQSIWVSGSNGQVLTYQLQKDLSVSNSIPSTIPWDTVSPRGFKKYDFRDVESLSETHALIMSVGDSGRILKTIDRGKTWFPVYQNFSHQVFLDGMVFDPNTGILVAIGDPQSTEELMEGDKQLDPNAPRFYLTCNKPSPEENNYYLMLISLDFGNTWQRIPACDALVPPDSIAAFFAGSGSSIHILKSSKKLNKNKSLTGFDILVGMAGGGLKPEYRILKIQGYLQENQPLKTDVSGNSSSATYQLNITHQTLPLSLGQGPGWGAYGGMINKQFVYWVGGNYLFPKHGDSTVNQILISHLDKPFRKKHIPQISIGTTSGYKSGVCECPTPRGSTLFAVGTAGIDYSINQGISWQPLKLNLEKKSQFNAAACFNGGIVLVGNQGLAEFLPLP